MTNGEAEADRRAVIEDVERVLPEADHLGEPIDDVRQMIEAVLEVRSVWRIAKAEAGQIGDHDMIAIRERGNEAAIHVR